MAVGSTDLIEAFHRGVHIFGDEVEVLHLVHDPGGAALLGGAVVGHHDEDGVVEQVTLPQPFDQASDLIVGVVQERSKRLLEAGGEPSLVVGQIVPRLDAGVAGGQDGVGRDDALVDLTLEPTLAHHVPALVEASPVLGQVFGWGLVGGVGGPEGQVGEEGAVGADRGRVRDHPQELVDQVLAQVVAVRGATRGFDVVVVAHQVGVELVGFTLEEPVEPVEAPSQRPLIEGSGGRSLFHGGQMPLAGAEGGVAGLTQDFGHGGGMVGDVTQLVGEPGSEVGQGPHPHRVLGTAGEQRGPGG